MVNHILGGKKPWTLTDFLRQCGQAHVSAGGLTGWQPAILGAYCRCIPLSGYGNKAGWGKC